MIRKFLRRWFIYIVALQVVAELITAIEFAEGLKTLLLATLVLTLFGSFIKPLLKILLLPVNLLTLGLLRWVINVVGLYTASFFVPSFTIKPYHFSGLTKGGLVIPPISFSSLATYILVSFGIDIALVTIRWILKK